MGVRRDRDIDRVLAPRALKVFDLIRENAMLSGILAFFVAWAAKHALDRLLLPRGIRWLSLISDRLALLSGKLARIRADRLLKWLSDDLIVISDVRHLVVASLGRIVYVIGLGFCALFCLVLLDIELHDKGIFLGIELHDNEKDYFSYFLAGIDAFCFLMFVGTTTNTLRRATSVFYLLRNIASRSGDTVERAVRLYQRAGLTEIEINKKIAAIPKLVPIESPPKPGPAWRRIHTYRLRIAACLLVDIEPNDPNDEPPQEAASMYQALDQAWHANELDRVPGTFPGARIVTRASLKEFAAKRGIEAPFLSD